LDQQLRGGGRRVTLCDAARRIAPA